MGSGTRGDSSGLTQGSKVDDSGLRGHTTMTPHSSKSTPTLEYSPSHGTLDILLLYGLEGGGRTPSVALPSTDLDP